MKHNKSYEVPDVEVCKQQDDWNEPHILHSVRKDTWYRRSWARKWLLRECSLSLVPNLDMPRETHGHVFYEKPIKLAHQAHFACSTSGCSSLNCKYASTCRKEPKWHGVVIYRGENKGGRPAR